MTLFDDLGGAAAVTAVVDDFYVRVLADPSLAPYFEGIDTPKLKGHQRAFITAALGGPQAYNGKPMGPAHAGLGVTEDAFNSVVGHLGATLSGLGVDDATIGIVAGQLAPLAPEIIGA
jgi:hemoglobin